ncbi:hypothetical protein ACFOOK_00840 [Micromonospora krabiensis]|uniref:Uncharacterized protein n=1 Tax=Micromonospora krabiensis TaxID=307121 RepID=A0A1C3MXK8_9ACTN|nr:hypothetical protein [Micromonospora krabiensis]SBV25072.1 hypothetical protein GA0070620_0541 [Micromonospora krabiensis]
MQTQAGEVPQEQLTVAFHHLLLRLAGRVPDELVAESRRWLAAGQFVEIAQAVVFAALAGRVEVTPADAGLLADVLTAAGEDTDALGELERSEVESQPRFGVAPVSPEVLAEAGDAVPYSLDLTVPYDGPGGLDVVDAAAVAAMPSLATAVALWRSWRFPAMGAQWPPPRRIYLVAGTDETRLPGLAAALQDTLEAVGETNPQVEVFVDPDGLPAYQRTMLGFSALLWAATPNAAPTLARVYDTVAPDGGPGFAPDRPRLADDEADQVARYLDDGVPLVITPELTPDVLDPAQEPVVPSAFRTDGRWIWSDAVGYYVRAYGLAPDAGLLDAIRGNAYVLPDVDAVAFHRALSVLYGTAVTADGADGPGGVPAEDGDGTAPA